MIAAAEAQVGRLYLYDSAFDRVHGRRLVILSKAGRKIARLLFLSDLRARRVPMRDFITYATLIDDVAPARLAQQLKRRRKLLRKAGLKPNLPAIREALQQLKRSKQ